MTVPCTTTIIPDITQIYGQPNPARVKAVQVNQGQVATINWTMRTPKGDPVDISSCGSTVSLSIKEAMLSPAPNPLSTIIAGTIVDGINGLVSATLTSDIVGYPGVSLAEFGVFDSHGNLVFSNQFYLVVNNGLFGTEIVAAGPPTVAEIRLHLYDSAPEDNFLLDDVEFDDGEIAACIIRPIQQFNDMQPPIDIRYNTSNFPYRYYWLEGIIAYLLLIAAHKYRRNKLTYQAGGIAVGDLDKEKEYLQAAMMHKQAWETFAKQKKVELNMEATFQQALSSYSYNLWPNY